MQTKIFVLNRNKDILDIIIRLINNNINWHAIGQSEPENLAHLFTTDHFDLVLIGSGFSSEEELEVKSILLPANPNVKIIHHWGGGSGLLSNEIMAALDGVEGNYAIQSNSN